MVFADGYEKALLGVVWREEIAIAVYDRQGVIAILCQRDGMTQEDAEEFFDYNIQGSWLGAATPIYLIRV